MNDFNYTINLIPDFRLRKKLLDVSPILIKGRVLRINPVMTTNLLILDRKTSKYMSDKLAMLYNSIVRDNTLVVTGTGNVGNSYVIKYDEGKLSITFSNKLTLTVTLSRKMSSIVNSEICSHNRTNYAVMLYVASAIMNIPKYEYPISIIDSTVHISTITINNIDVLYTDTDILPYPKKLKKLNSVVSNKITELRNHGDVLSIISKDSNVYRVLALINYCRYYATVTPLLLKILLSNVSSTIIDDEHLDNMIIYMELYREIVYIKDKYELRIPYKQIK